MFVCGITGQQSKPGEKCHRITVETRAKTYKHWDKEAEEEWFSHGTEIVREINASEEGRDKWNALTPEQQAEWVKLVFYPKGN